MLDRIISISAAPYDGYEFPALLDSIASCGAQYVEPAFIVGYTESFDESSFNLSAEAPRRPAALNKDRAGCFYITSSAIIAQNSVVSDTH